MQGVNPPMLCVLECQLLSLEYQRVYPIVNKHSWPEPCLRLSLQLCVAPSTTPQKWFQ